ncbi:hypothetical protein [Nostoc sp.]|uniref:hypothetical protein n=1 Tax=Nostoc sp. TaxID=1180 RepID=UPI002FFBAEA8
MLNCRPPQLGGGIKPIYSDDRVLACRQRYPLFRSEFNSEFWLTSPAGDAARTTAPFSTRGCANGYAQDRLGDHLTPEFCFDNIL